MTLVAHIYSTRWGHTDMYEIKWVKAGWELVHSGRTIGVVGPDGHAPSRGIYSVMGNDSITYPDVMPLALQHLHDEINASRMTHPTAQAALDEFVDWLNLLNQKKPGRTGGPWGTVF